MAIDRSGAYFHKTVGVIPTNTIEEQELAVAYLARNAHGPDDLRDLLDELGLEHTAKRLAERRFA